MPRKLYGDRQTVNLVNSTNPVSSENYKTGMPSKEKMHYCVNSSDLAHSAKILTHPDYYSEKEVNNSKKYIDYLLDERINEDIPLDAQYKKLAVSLKQYMGGEISKDSVEEEMLNTFSSQNKENGISRQVLKEVSLAYDQLGNHEALDGAGYGTNSGDEISKYFETGWYGSPWCAMFVSWLNDEGQENPESNQNTFGFQESVASIKNSACEAGYYESKDTYDPIPGDLIILDSGGESHVGMVYDVDDENVYAIEGNKCDMVRPVVYDKNGSYYQNCVSGYVKMNEWTGGDINNSINTEFLPDLETAILPETQCYPVPGEWDDVATGGFVNIFRT